MPKFHAQVIRRDFHAACAVYDAGASHLALPRHQSRTHARSVSAVSACVCGVSPPSPWDSEARSPPRASYAQPQVPFQTHSLNDRASHTAEGLKG
ncbi:MAG: hypothetical protein L6R37_003481 [Teloschistes peruensis]|nr:MAG: hypothetical protein L6R37_003481 [Teloschistes peruensis]